jgi:two-component system, OmpR family, response regulator CpxR
VFNRFTRERERAVAYLREALSHELETDDLLVTGLISLLVPVSIGHALRVCLVAPPSYRAEQLRAEQEATLREAQRQITEFDERAADWAGLLVDVGPYDRALFDVVIPMHSTTVDQAVAIIVDNLAKPAVQRCAESEQAVRDFGLAARVNVALTEAGYDVDVTAESGRVTVLINRYAMRLDHLERELVRLASAVDGVESATTRIGPRYHQPGIYVDLDVETPAKILLVDDEKDFVHTLSERLESRNMGSAVAYDGEQALAIVDRDEPEVVVLDLQMPGLSGFDVLRRIKRTHPATQVIILTGHGGDKERQLADDLGAFAYLRKPVDIAVLSETMKKAYRQSEQDESEIDDPAG